MTAKKPRKMVALKVLETSGVDHPAHLEEGWVVMKNTEDTVPEEIELVGSVDDEYVDRVVELEAELAKAREAIAELTKSADPEDGDADDDASEDLHGEDLIKSLPEPVREMLAKAQSEAEGAREELRKEREIARDREYVAKASKWSNLSIEASEFGIALRKVADIDANLATVIETAFEAANAQQEAASIFAELGGNGRPAAGNAFGQVSNLAKAAVDAGEYSTIEQAISGLVAKNPDLYNQYLADKR